MSYTQVTGMSSTRFPLKGLSGCGCQSTGGLGQAPAPASVLTRIGPDGQATAVPGMTMTTTPAPRWLWPALIGFGGLMVWFSVVNFTRDVRRISEGAESLGFFASKMRRNRRRRSR